MGEEKPQPKQVRQESAAPKATRVSSTAQTHCSGAMFMPCADSCTPPAVSHTVAFHLPNHFAHSAILASYLFALILFNHHMYGYKFYFRAIILIFSGGKRPSRQPRMRA